MTRRLLIVAAATPALLVASLLLGRSSADALRLPSAPACSIFPASNAWNQRVDSLPVAADSAQLISSIGLTTGLHPDFGSGLYDGSLIGIPFDVVSRSAPRPRVTFDYADESDKGPYPIPKTVHTESGRASDGDRHALLVDRSACKLHELYASYPKTGGAWKAGSGAIWNLRSNAVTGGLDVGRRRWAATSSRARATTKWRAERRPRVALHRRPDAACVRYPARHHASVDDPSLPPMGARVRLKASVDISAIRAGRASCSRR